MHDKIKSLLSALGFTSKKETPEIFSKVFGSLDKPIIIDFNKEEIIYPESTAEGTNQPNGMLVHERTTCNFSAPENFVVLECVCRLLEKGYRPEHIEIEKPWSLGHTAVGGRADIVVSDEKREKTLLIIECKRFGTEYNKALSQLREDGGQLFSYWQQERATKWLCLYASQLNSDGKIEYKQTIISTSDDANVAGLAEKDKTILLYKKASTVPELFTAWDETYHKAEVQSDILFGPDTTAYQIGIAPLRKRDLVNFSPDDQIVNKFEENLRHNNVSDKENAFNRLIALFICKLVGEQKAWKEWTKPEYFAQFKKEFEESTQIKNRRASNAFKKLSEDEQERDLNRRFYDFVKTIEREKLKIFSLIHNQATLIINAPSDNAKQKAFLGYEWSGRKGNEGLHMIKEGGELYNPHDFDDPASLNTTIRKTFDNDCANPPGDYSQIAFLKNLIDFTRTDFNHAIKMTVDKKVEVKSVYPMVKLGDEVETLGGLWTGKKPPFKKVSVIRNTNFTSDGFLDLSDVAIIDVELKSFQKRKLEKGDIIIEKSGGSETQAVGRVVLFNESGDFSYSNFTTRLRVADKRIIPAYLHLTLHEFYRKGGTFRFQAGSSGLKNLNLDDYLTTNIPLPPLDVQREIVKDCQAIDKEVSAAQKAIEVAKNKIAQQVGICMSQNLKTIRIESLLISTHDVNASRKLPEKSIKSTGKYPVVTQSTSSLVSGYTDENIAIIDVPILVFGDHTCAIKYIDFPFVRGADGTQLMKVDETKATTRFLGLVISHLEIENAEKYQRHYKYLKQMSIPIPSLAEQKRVVAEVEKLEGEIASARALIASAPDRKSKILKDRL